MSLVNFSQTFNQPESVAVLRFQLFSKQYHNFF